MLRIIRPWEKGLIERFGRYIKTVGSGLTVVIPVADKLRKVDMREQVVEVPPQAVITKDNVVVDVDAVVYYQVVDPMKVCYEVQDFYAAATKLAQTSLRNLIGDLALDESLTSREVINSTLRKLLDEASEKWGVKVTRVELQRIEPPKDVTEAMHRQMKAERDRRATILTAEGQKQSEILEAEGEQQARILRAEGEAQAIERVSHAEKFRERTIAGGEAAAIREVFQAINEAGATREVIALKYLETLQAIANGKATKVFLPYETSSVLASVASLAEVLGKDSAAAPE